MFNRADGLINTQCTAVITIAGRFCERRSFVQAGFASLRLLAAWESAAARLET